MSEAVSIERRKIIRSYGAKVILTPAEEGTDGAIRYARAAVASDPDRYFMPDQFANASNYLAHYQSTALEIWQQTGGEIDYLVCALGTSGTLMGLSRFLKAMKPDIKVVCAQPTRGHYIQGLKNMEEAIVPDIYDPSKIDIQEMVESEEAIAMARRIIAREAIFAGMSSGAALLAAVRTAARIERGNIVVGLPRPVPRSISARRCSTNSTTDLPPYAAPFAHRRHLQPCGAVAHDAAVGRRADGARGRVGVRGGGQQFDRRYGRAFRGVSLGASRLPLRRVSETRQGLSWARNRGIAETTGDIVAIIDDDERIVPEFIAAYIAFFDAHPSVASAGGPIVAEYPAGRPAWMSRYTERPIAQPDRSGADAPSLPARADSRRREPWRCAARRWGATERSTRNWDGAARGCWAARRATCSHGCGAAANSAGTCPER